MTRSLVCLLLLMLVVAHRSVHAGDVTADDIAALSSARFAEREAARERLAAGAENRATAVGVVAAFERRLREEIPPCDLATFTAACDEVIARWSLHDDAAAALPPIDDAVLRDLAERIGNASVEEEIPRRAMLHARLLLHDATHAARFAELLAKIEADIAAQQRPAVSRDLQTLIELARPAIVAEIWSRNPMRSLAPVAGNILFMVGPEDGKLADQPRPVAEQYLWLGVPQYPRGAPRATFFDNLPPREKNAAGEFFGPALVHCASGNTLTPGDYPLGVAFPHPHPLQATTTFFHLSSLPAPRDRERFRQELERPLAVRQRELSERTAAYHLRYAPPLTENHFGTFALIDAETLGLFAAAYMVAYPDAKVLPPPENLQAAAVQNGFQPALPPLPAAANARPPCSVHPRLGLLVAERGTADCVAPFLLMDADREKHGEATRAAVELALLGVAARETTPELNKWLRSVVNGKRTWWYPCDEKTPAFVGDLSASAVAAIHTRQQRPLPEPIAPSDGPREMTAALPVIYRWTTSDDAARQRIIDAAMGLIDQPQMSAAIVPARNPGVDLPP